VFDGENTHCVGIELLSFVSVLKNSKRWINPYFRNFSRNEDEQKHRKS